MVDPQSARRSTEPPRSRSGQEELLHAYCATGELFREGRARFIKLVILHHSRLGINSTSGTEEAGVEEIDKSETENKIEIKRKD